MYLCRSVVLSFSLLGGIPLYECTTVCLSILSVEGHLAFQGLVILHKAAINIHMYRFLCEQKFSFLSGRYLGL